MPKTKARKITNWEQVPVIFDLSYAALLFGYTIDTLQKKAKKGEFPAHKKLGKWLVFKDEAEKWLKEGC